MITSCFFLCFQRTIDGDGDFRLYRHKAAAAVEAVCDLSREMRKLDG